MNEKMLISIVIPTHNRADLLKKAISSVLNQSYQNIEVVVIDDASTEDNQHLIDSFNSDKLVYYKFEQNQGGNKCRNKGVEISHGEYIAFLDDDDIWNNNKLELQVNFMIDNKIDLSYTGKNIILLNEKLERISSHYSYHEPKYKNLEKSIMKKNFIGTTSTIMIKKSSFNEVGGFQVNLQAMQDYEFYVRCASLNLKIAGINMALIEYFIYLNNNSVGRNIKKHITAKNTILNKYKESKYYKFLYIHINIIIVKKYIKAQKYKFNLIIFDTLNFFRKRN